MMSPSCIENKKAMAIVQRLMMEDMAKKQAMMHQQAKPTNPANSNPSRAPLDMIGQTNDDAGSSGVQPKTNTDIDSKVNPSTVTNGNNTNGTSTSGTDNAANVTQQPDSNEGRVITIPDFQKLSTHKDYDMFKRMSKNMGIDLEAVKAMPLNDQVC